MATHAPLEATPASLNLHTTMDPAPPSTVDMDAGAQKGWNWFTKFLMWNVISVVATLIVVGLLTVWS